jgi:alkylation response protein AidB-like acyl-CoA dehydrogenase
MSEKLNGILEAARLHAEEVILPHVDDWNIAKTWPRAASDKAGAAGLMGLYAPEAFGGQGLPLSEGIQVYEQLGLGYGAYAFALSMHVDTAPKHLKTYGEWNSPLVESWRISY